MVLFLDWKSTALVGYEIMLEENTQCIASALRNAIINLDMIPKVVYQDNGRAFRAKYFTDDKGFSELGFNGLYSKLGIETVFARPYNARAKVIERFFKEFQEGFEKWLEYVHDFGFGTKLDTDISGELAGTLPSVERYDKLHGKGRWHALNIISLSIGQGELGCTPLQLANFVATIANKGYYYIFIIFFFGIAF